MLGSSDCHTTKAWTFMHTHTEQKVSPSGVLGGADGPETGAKIIQGWSQQDWLWHEGWSGDHGDSQTQGKGGVCSEHCCLWTHSWFQSWHLQTTVRVCHTLKQDLVFNTSIPQCWVLSPSFHKWGEAWPGEPINQCLLLVQSNETGRAQTLLLAFFLD